VLILDEGAVGARAVLVEFVGPESLLVIALQVRPDSLQGGDQVVDEVSIEASTAVAGPGAVIVLGPESVNDPIVEAVGSRVAARGGADGTRPSLYSKQGFESVLGPYSEQEGRGTKV
jgi:hypothetical protein